MNQEKLSIKNIRKNYGRYELRKKTVSKNPFRQFRIWIDIAFEQKVNEPNAMNLSTVDKKGRPSSRIVLLRGYDNNGFVFYTNYLSRKGTELMSNPYGALTFFWSELEKQIRIEGKIVKVPKAISDRYFKSRPRESQIGAWASYQSAVLKSRDELEKIVKNLTLKYKGKPVPRPDYWGGYFLIPDKFEFWQGRANRLHDRIMYEITKENNWKISRLSP